MPTVQRNLRSAQYLPVLAAFAVCLAFVGYFCWTVVRQTGMFVYPLDDTYIHLAVAHNLAAHHVWGIGAAEFSSASSSPGWTVLLMAIEVVFGLHVLAPLMVNLILALCLLIVSDRAVRRYAPETPVWARCGIGVLLVVATPLPSLAMTGMEHVAQTLCVLLLVVSGVEVLVAEADGAVSPGRAVGLCASAALAGAFRYETVFAIAPICLLLLVRKRWLLALAVGSCAAIGPLAFGIYSHRISGFWLPFSVVSKEAWDGGIVANLRRGAGQLMQPRLGLPIELLLMPGFIGLWRRYGFWGRQQLLALLTLVISVTHMMLAPVGWFLRYESYFVFLFLLAVSVVLAGFMWPLEGVRTEHGLRGPGGDRWRAVLMVGYAAAVLFPMVYVRMGHGARDPGRAAVDRANQHIMMARFIGTYYDHDTIVLNDIGAVAFYTDAKILDVFGLGSKEPLLTLRAGRRFTADDVERWASERNASIAIMSTGWYKTIALTPEDWIVAQRWYLSRSVQFEDHDIGVYALKRSELPRLCSALRQFKLPDADSVKGGACDEVVVLTGAGR